MADKRENFALPVFIEIIYGQALQVIIESCPEFDDHFLARHP